MKGAYSCEWPSSSTAWGVRGAKMKGAYSSSFLQISHDEGGVNLKGTYSTDFGGKVTDTCVRGAKMKGTYNSP